MRNLSKIRVAVVGLRFGASFVPIYRDHRDVESVAICDLDAHSRDAVGEKWGIPVSARFDTLERLLDADVCDAVHLVTPVAFHCAQACQVLAAGKHCASAVPMAAKLDDLLAIHAAQAKARKNYMMMETAVYTREFLYVKQLMDEGRLGDLTFLRGSHIQDLEGLPPYWQGYPPMHYITHALSPLLALAGTRAAKVACLGSGTLPTSARGKYDNPFPLQSALFRLADSDLAAEVTMSFFQTTRPYTESFSVYGDQAGFEWPQHEGNPAFLYEWDARPENKRGRPIRTTPVHAPFRPDLLPASLAPYVEGGHGGSHPHLAHEFVRSIVEKRRPLVDTQTAARWTASGLCAHQSSLNGGAWVDVPDFAPSVLPVE